MARRSRDEQLMLRIAKMLDADEEVVVQTRCWAVGRRKNVPLLLLGRHRYDAVLTDRRVMLFRRRLRRRRAGEVVLAKRYTSLTLEDTHRRPLLLQHRVRADTGARYVVEWPVGNHAAGESFGDALTGAARAPNPWP